MERGIYYTNQIPTRPVSLTIRDDSGMPLNLAAYETISAILLGTNNERLDVSDGQIVIADRPNAVVNFYWPQRNVMQEPGDYVLQLALMTEDGRRDYTSPAHFKVKQLGGSR